MRTHETTLVALCGLAALAGPVRAQHGGDPGLDPRVARDMPPQVFVNFQCQCPDHGGQTDGAPVTWPNGIVPFEIAPSNANPALTRRAMDIWMFRAGPSPNVTFVKRDPADPAHNNYVVIIGVPGDVSSSYVGMVGGGQEVKQGFLVNDYVMAHEFGHALGFYHEHTRPERDSYVTVWWERVHPSNAQTNFQIQNTWVANGLNTSYDFDSVMHYAATSFMNTSCDGGLATCISVLTCTPLVARADLGYGIYQCTMGQQSFLSTSDVQDMINVYGQRQRTLSYIGPNANLGAGTISNPYQYPLGGGGDVYFEGGSTYHVQAGTRFTSAATWRKHSGGVARITAP